VLWSLLLQADPEGHTLIFCAASWRTTSNLSALLKPFEICGIHNIFVIPMFDISHVNISFEIGYQACAKLKPFQFYVSVPNPKS
jgi:hypothetical protein